MVVASRPLSGLSSFVHLSLHEHVCTRNPALVKSFIHTEYIQNTQLRQGLRKSTPRTQHLRYIGHLNLTKESDQRKA